MDYLLSVLLGIVEGLTEFLPVSSTAHLRIAQAFMGIDLDNGYWKMYAVVIQLGAILSVLVLYGQRLTQYARTFPNGKDNNRTWWNHPLTLIAVAFVVTAGPAYVLKKTVIDKNLGSPWVIVGSLLIGGLVMWAIDILCRRPITDSVEKMGFLDAIWIGAVQILSAVFPGTSRSMSTIAAGQVFGMSRSAALDFSFLVSLPIMFAACAKEFYDAMKEMKHNPAFIPADLQGNPWVILAIGFAVSFVVALAINRWFIGWVKKRGFGPFAAYRIVLALALIALLVSFPGHFAGKASAHATIQPVAGTR